MSINDMWERLTQHQPYADERGYGPEWAKMCAERTSDAAWAAADAAVEAELAVEEAPWAARVTRARAERAAAQAAQAAAEADAEAVAVKAVEWIEKAEGRE